MSDVNSGLEPQQWTSLSRPELVEQAVLRGEGVLSRIGALVVESITPEDNFSADRFIVEEPSTEDVIDWRRNQSFSSDDFDRLWQQVEVFLAHKDSFVQYVHGGDDQQYYLPIKVVTETAWQSLAALNLFTPVDIENYNNKSKAEWQILNVPSFVCPAEGVVSERAVITNYARRKVLLVGMHNGGEMKKAMYTVLSFLLPEREVLPLHSSANIDHNQKVTLLVGASGSGKTTLASGPNLKVIGDDEIGWGKSDLFNLEGGFYLRTGQLKEAEANEWFSPVRFGAVTENVILNPQRGLDFESEQTINFGRCAYPFAYSLRAPMSMIDVSPDYIVLLSRDYSGVLPPLSRLSTKAAAYHYLCGYNSVLSKNGENQCSIPQFRACFAAPYLPRPPTEYADLFIKRLEQSDCHVYLMNTGVVGDIQQGKQRLAIADCQKLLQGIQSGVFDDASYRTLNIIGLDIPEGISGYENDYFDPSLCWETSAAYALAAEGLLAAFADESERLDIPQPSRLASLGQ